MREGRDYMRLQPTKNLIRAARFLAADPLTLRQLGTKLGMCSRSARRLIYALRAIGCDVTSMPYDRVYFGGEPREFGVRYRLDHRSWSALLCLPPD